MLDQHLHYLQNQFTLISLSQLLEIYQQRRPIDRNLVVITFDDGYADNYTAAFPLVVRRGVPITVFLTVAYIDTFELPWWHKLDWALDSTRAEHLTVDGRTFGLRSPLERRKAAVELRRMLKSYPEGELDRKAEELARKLGVDEPLFPTPYSFLTWKQVADMHSAGVEFGAHTLTHRILTKIPFAEAKAEIAGSKRQLEGRLGREVASFAYPNGQPDDFSPSLQMAVREASYTCALSTIYGFNDLSSDLYALRRCVVDTTDPVPVLSVRLCGLWPLVLQLKRATQSRRIT